jgi:phosphoribosyl 1,2-cyclic phosphodiesterase
MQLIVINSNSAGNAYVLRSETGEALLIECGVRFQDIKKALGFNLGKVVGCLVSHEHKDHCKSVNDVLNAGIFVYSAYDTHEAMKTEFHHRSRFLHRHITTGIGPFDVIAYDVKHDAADPFCFLIRHKECGTVLFLTDSYYCEYNFKGLNQVIIEANYCQQILDRSIVYM